jgi:protein gp37
MASQGDLWHPEVPFGFTAAVFGMMGATPQHRYLLLTKRPARMLEWFDWVGVRPEVSHHLYEGLYQHTRRYFQITQLAQGLWPLPNVWLGVTACNQEEADAKIPLLLQAPAAHRWVSLEPLLAEVYLPSPWLHDRCAECGALLGGPTRACSCEGRIAPGLDWVVLGGESGPGARPMHPDWARAVRDQCQAARSPLYYKQGPGDHGDSLAHQPLLDGRQWLELPWEPKEEPHA